MAYFSNATEAMDYQAAHCATCIHGEQCAVWEAHEIVGDDAANDPEHTLHLLIPQTSDGLGNGTCFMYYKTPEAPE